MCLVVWWLSPQGKQVMRSRPIGREIRHIWPGHIADDLEWRTDVSVEWTQVVDTLGLSRHHVRVAPLQFTTAPMSAAPFGLDSRVVQPRPRKVGEIWDATWLAHVGSPWWEHNPWAAEPSYTPAGWHDHGESAGARCVAEHRQPVNVAWSQGAWDGTHRDVKLGINVLVMSTSSPDWHTILCDWVYQSNSRCAKYRSWCNPVSSCRFADDVAARLNFIAHIFCMFLYVSDLSRVTPRYFGAKSYTSTSPASVTFSCLAACLLSRWKQVATVFFAFRRSSH